MTDEQVKDLEEASKNWWLVPPKGKCEGTFFTDWEMAAILMVASQALEQRWTDDDDPRLQAFKDKIHKLVQDNKEYFKEVFKDD